MKALFLFLCNGLVAFSLLGAESARGLPNILWLTSEDNGPHLGAYGDSYAVTPNLDALAGRGLRYLNAWSTAPVCAPARTTIISGVYPPALGAEHMRSGTRLPSFMKMYPQFLKERGYYCTNNSKKDYNLEEPGKVWDESSRKAHWKNRKEGQPFFAIFNYTTSHESQLRKRPHTLVHDPAKVRVPAYHPDTPEVRHDWAQYYDKITEMDGQVGKALEELAAAGLADDTIIFYYGDHGSGMPRSKRWPYNSGLQVPLIVHIPAKYKDLAPKEYVPGGSTDRLVGFVDLAPTLLSLVGIEPPKYMQGSAFMGEFEAKEREFNFGFRGRMDECYDMVRSVRDKRYIYIRNYMPHKIYGQYLEYMFQTPTTRVWRKLYDEGKLNEAQSRFWQTKPSEELYDLRADPDEIRNLAGLPEHKRTVRRLRKAQQQLARQIRDIGFLPEGEMHSRGGEGMTPYEMGHDKKLYPMKKIMETAELASSGEEGDVAKLRRAFGDKDSAVRYWAAMGILMRGEAGLAAAGGEMREALSDASPNVRVIAAEGLGRYGTADDVKRALDVLMEAAPADKNGPYVSMLALNSLTKLGSKASGLKDRIAALPVPGPEVEARVRGYVGRLKARLAETL